MKRELIEKVYNCAKSNFKKSHFTFNELFDVINEKEKSIKNDDVVDLYVELLQDIRFISLGKDKWALRENFTIADINKIRNSMFGLEEYHEEDAFQFMSDVEKNELKQKNEKSDKLIIEEDPNDDSIDETPNIKKLVNEEESDIDKSENEIEGDSMDIETDILDNDDDDEIDEEVFDDEEFDEDDEEDNEDDNELDEEIE